MLAFLTSKNKVFIKVDQLNKKAFDNNYQKLEALFIKVITSN